MKTSKSSRKVAKLRTLRQARTRQKIAQKDLAQKVGLLQCRLSRLEAGKELVHLPYLLLIEEILNEKIDWFHGSKFNREESQEIAGIITDLAGHIPVQVILPYFQRVMANDDKADDNKIAMLKNVIIRFDKIGEKSDGH